MFFGLLLSWSPFLALYSSNSNLHEVYVSKEPLYQRYQTVWFEKFYQTNWVWHMPHSTCKKNERTHNAEIRCYTVMKVTPTMHIIFMIYFTLNSYEIQIHHHKLYLIECIHSKVAQLPVYPCQSQKQFSLISLLKVDECRSHTNVPILHALKSYIHKKKL